MIDHNIIMFTTYVSYKIYCQKSTYVSYKIYCQKCSTSKGYTFVRIIGEVDLLKRSYICRKCKNV